MGFTDLSRLYKRNRFRSGQCYLPDKEFRSDKSLIYLGLLSRVNPMSFLLILHVAMQMGLYLHRQAVGVWRVVSEDSDHFGARLAVIHCLRDPRDLEQPTCCEMRVHFNQPHTRYELEEIAFLGGSQRVLLKEGNDRVKKITSFRNNELIQIFLVIVESTIGVNATNTKEIFEHV